MSDEMREIVDALLRLNAVIGEVVDNILDEKITMETAANLQGAANALPTLARAFVHVRVNDVLGVPAPSTRETGE